MTLDVEARLRELHGGVSRESGVIHVTALWRAPDGPPRALRIAPATPRSETDLFVLSAARARAQAIVTTGAILRAEPELSHALQGPPEVIEGLEHWRHELLGLDRPPQSVVLTSGSDLDLGHPLLHTGRALLFVPEAAAPGLREAAGGRGIEVVGHPAPGIRELVTWLRRERNLRAISIEAGPTTARELYAPPPLVDELWLSVFEEAQLPAELAGPAFLPSGELERLLPRASHPVRRVEPSGAWAFSRRRRA